MSQPAKVDVHQIACDGMRDGIVGILRGLRESITKAAEVALAEAELASAKRQLVELSEFKAAACAHLEDIEIIDSAIADCGRILGGGQ